MGIGDGHIQDQGLSVIRIQPLLLASVDSIFLLLYTSFLHEVEELFASYCVSTREREWEKHVLRFSSKTLGQELIERAGIMTH